MISTRLKTIIAAAAGAAVVGTGAALAHDDSPNAGPAAPAANVVDKSLPAGVSTATSFWDPSTASGLPMSYKTIASPYWPLGTKVKITYGGKSTVGVVQDFGPAEWAVAQHDPPALVDLSEKMMRDLTGDASNSVTVKFQVLKMGTGPVYRHDGTGYKTATTPG